MLLFTPLPTATRLMTDATSTASTTPLVTGPDLDRFALLDSLGLTVTAHRSSPTTPCCSVGSRPLGPIRGCGGQGGRHDTVLRRFTHLPLSALVPMCARCGAERLQNWTA